MMTHELSLVNMYLYYTSEINKVCNNIEFRRSVGILPDEKTISKNNEELYRLFMFRNNMSDLIGKIDNEDK